uniref:Uncharacterized protein n=1 Tax=Anguilla anguilla TaxID=7936 RepID=A0A0E9Q2B1_ANGAN
MTSVSSIYATRYKHKVQLWSWPCIQMISLDLKCNHLNNEYAFKVQTVSFFNLRVYNMHIG